MINRNNYEEYFLLLADNELSAEEATAVKQFAAQHPDLAEELDILLSCRLDDVAMPVFPKEKLLRTAEWDIEKLEPEQTKMLLLLDGELPLAEKEQLQKQIANSIALQTEWNTLQQTKLVVEAIVHPNKASLQHTDRKVRPLLWMRWAAAAAVVAGLGWLFWLQQEPQPVVPATTLASTDVPVQKVEQKVPTSAEVQPQPIAVDAQPTSTPQLASNTPATHSATTPPQKNTQPDETTHRLAKNDNSLIAVNSNIENTPTETQPATTQLHNANISLTASEEPSAPPMQVAQLSTKAVALPVLAASQNEKSFTGSKTDLKTEEEEYVTIGGAHINKQKMRGLFRNVARKVSRSFTKSKLEPDVYVAR